MKSVVAVVCCFMVTLSFAVGSYGQEPAKPAAFYKGKNIDFILNEAPGGDADLLGRLLGPYVKEHTGATPIFVNRRSAGGVEGYVYLSKAAPDGLAMGIGTTLPMLLNKITGAPGAIYEPDKFGYVCSFLRVRNVFIVAAKGPYKTIADLKKAKKLVLGGTSPQGNLALATMSSIKLLDLDAKVITGTKGPGPLLQDILSGEIAGTCLPMQLAMRGIRDGNYRALFTLANERFSAIPDVPSLKEAYDMAGDEEKKELLAMWDQSLVMSQAIITPPGLAKEKLDFLREIYAKLKSSPQFRKDMDKLFAFHVEDADILAGPEAEKLVKDAMTKAGKMKSIFLQFIKEYRL
jgi:tripartite-type tricarboxylate transporter receptor subunit TctC